MVSELTKPSMALDHLGDGAPPTSWWQMWSEERTARRASRSSPWMRV